MAVTSRLIRHLDHCEEEENGMKAEIDRLKLVIEEEKSLHENTKFFCEGLKKDLAASRTKASEAEKECDGFRSECGELKVDLVGMSRKLESVEVKLKMSEEARVHVKKSFVEYKALGPPLTDVLKQQIRQDYRKSTELVNEVIQQFTDCYEEARDKDKAKLAAANLDPKILDSSDEEANS